MYFSQHYTIIFFLVGLVLLLFSLFTIIKILTILHTHTWKASWIIILLLSLIFCITYAINSYFIYTERISSLIFSFGITSLLGGIFVYLVTRVGYTILKNFIVTNNALTKEIETSQLANKKLSEQSKALADANANMAKLYLDLEEAKDMLEEKEATLIYQATHDLLTGLPNRFLLVDHLDKTLAHAKANNLIVAVLFLDLDRFKNINDGLGHKVGDALLITVAERLKNHIHKEDLIARLGGDEFVIVLGTPEKKNQVDTIAKNILNSLMDPVKIEGHEFITTASIGVSFYPHDGQDAEILIKNADSAMYSAKEYGRNSVQYYKAQMNARIARRLEMENDLRHAQERGELEVLYQPIYNLQTEQLTGAEALLRWYHPHLGSIPREEFILLAEETGLIIPIGEWVLNTACQQNERWREQKLLPIRISVNLSSWQFKQIHILEMVNKVLMKTNLSPQSLELELTESIFVEHVKEQINKLHRLKELGVMLAIDDFGTGYSSLSYLKAFPIDRLKIDKSFIRDIPGDPDDTGITLAIIAMAKNLKLKVLAEGIETEQQLAFLRQNHCDEGQGYLFSKPVDAEAFSKILTEASGQRQNVVVHHKF